MPFPIVPAVLGGVSLLSGLFNRGGQRVSTQPTEPKEFFPLRTQIMNNIMRRLQSGGLPEGFESTGIQTINQSFDPIQKAIEADVTSRGLGSSPMGAAVSRNVNLARGGEIAQFRARLPMLARQQQERDLLTAMRFFGQRIPGRETNVENPGSLGSGIDDLGEMLGFLFESGAFSRGGNSGIGNLKI